MMRSSDGKEIRISVDEVVSCSDHGTRMGVKKTYTARSTLPNSFALSPRCRTGNYEAEETRKPGRKSETPVGSVYMRET